MKRLIDNFVYPLLAMAVSAVFVLLCNTIPLQYKNALKNFPVEMVTLAISLILVTTFITLQILKSAYAKKTRTIRVELQKCKKQNEELQKVDRTAEYYHAIVMQHKENDIGLANKR